jgi:ABC-2 type transport system permease protein
MRTIKYLLQKEFKQISRNKTLLPIIFIMPIIQLLILVHATTFEVKNVKLTIVDQDKSNTSARLINKLYGSGYFLDAGHAESIKEAEMWLDKNEADAILVIPPKMDMNLAQEKKAQVQIIANAINSNSASLAYAYISNVTMDFNRQIIAEWIGNTPPVPLKQINILPRYWFNPELNYKWYMYPGIMVILISMIGMFLTGLNLVREKEIGTSEQLNVTPMHKFQFIIGKLLPFLIIGIFELILAVILGRFVYNVPLLGSVWVLLGFTIIYLLVVLGLGLFISTMADTQQQMMFIAFFFVIVFILLSGIFTPIESMPKIVQKINIINPFTHYMKVLRMVMLKGSSFKNLWFELITLSVYAVSIISLAAFRYRKTA